MVSVGEIHRRGGVFYYSRSPLYNFWGKRIPIFTVVGEITQGRFLYILVLPTMFLAPMQFAHLAMGQVAYDTVMRAQGW